MESNKNYIIVFSQSALCEFLILIKKETKTIIKMSFSVKNVGSKQKDLIIVGIVAAVFVLIVIIGVIIGVYLYVTREKNNPPQDVKFTTYEQWSNVQSSGKPEDAGTPPTTVYGSIDLYITDDDVTNGNWKPASSTNKNQMITNTSPGNYKNTSKTQPYSFTLNVSFDSGTVTFPEFTDFDPSKEYACYLIGYTTFIDGDAPPSNGRPDYGANSERINNVTLGTPIGFQSLTGSFENVILYPGQILNVSLNILASPLPKSSTVQRILKNVTFNISSGSITKPSS
jgi:hypothetical protein